MYKPLQKKEIKSKRIHMVTDGRNHYLPAGKDSWGWYNWEGGLKRKERESFLPLTDDETSVIIDKDK